MRWKEMVFASGWLDEQRKPTNIRTIWHTEEAEVTIKGHKRYIYRIYTITSSTQPIIRVKGEIDIEYKLGDVFFCLEDYHRFDGTLVRLVYKPKSYFCHKDEDDSRLPMTEEEISLHQEATQEALKVHPFGHILNEIHQGLQHPIVYYHHLHHRN